MTGQDVKNFDHLFQDYIRKPFVIGAVQITPLNINEVAEACGGEVKHDGKKENHFSRDYIQVPVKQAINDRQRQGYVGDWIVKQGRTFKVYPDKQFQSTFEIRANGQVTERKQPAKKAPSKNQKRKGKGAQGRGPKPVTQQQKPGQFIPPSPSQMPKKRSPESSNERKPLPEPTPKELFDEGVRTGEFAADEAAYKKLEQEVDEAKAAETPLKSEHDAALESREAMLAAEAAKEQPVGKPITPDELNSQPGDPRTADDIHREAIQTPGQKVRGEACVARSQSRSASCASTTSASGSQWSPPPGLASRTPSSWSVLEHTCMIEETTSRRSTWSSRTSAPGTASSDTAVVSACTCTTA